MPGRPRPFEYRGDEPYVDTMWVNPGEPYIATEPLTPDDVELVPSVEVTAEVVAWADFYADQEDSEGDADWHQLLDDRPCSKHHMAMARRITERLAARQAATEGQ